MVRSGGAAYRFRKAEAALVFFPVSIFGKGIFYLVPPYRINLPDLPD